MGLVTLLTIVLFFTSSLLLPFVPTALASSLVLFLGMELGLEALWEAALTLPRLDWGICMATLIACTFIGFAEGFIVGILVAAFIHCVYGSAESVSSSRIFPSIRMILTYSTEASHRSSNFDLTCFQLSNCAHVLSVKAFRQRMITNVPPTAGLLLSFNTSNSLHCHTGLLLKICLHGWGWG